MLVYGAELVPPYVYHGRHESEHSLRQNQPTIFPTFADTETVYLCPFDHMYARCWTHRFLVFHVNDSNFERAVQDLNDGLCRLASLVPYIKGRVFKPSTAEHSVRENGNLRHPRNRLALTWSRSAPAPKVHELPVPDARELPSLTELIDQNFPAHYFTEDLSTQPSAWTTHTSDPKAGAPVFLAGYIRIEGGLILSITNHHGVFDGVGSSDLMRLWAACTRGSTPGIVADADDPFMRRPEIARHIGSQCHMPAYDSSHCTMTGPQVVNLGRGSNCRARIFAFSENKVQLAKQALGDLNLVEHGKNTANNIINSILWSCITRVRLIRQTNHAALEPEAKQSRLGLAVNGRSKVFGPEAARTSSYLGNLTFVATANTDVAQLNDVARTISYHQNPAVMAKNLGSLVPLLGSLARAVDKIDISYIGQVFSGIEMVGDIETLARPIVPGDVFCAYEGMNLNCSSWANMGLYECDFGPTFSDKDQGIGTPVAVRFICDQSVDGAIMILPRRRMSTLGERIEVHISLNEEDLQVLEEDQVLQSWLCQ